MGTFIAAFVALWLAVVLYTVRLGSQQRRLLRELQALRLQLDPPAGAERPPAEAA